MTVKFRRCETCQKEELSQKDGSVRSSKRGLMGQKREGDG